MKAVLPGKPEASLQAISTGYWDGRRIVVYVTGNALSILSNPGTILHTIYDDDSRSLEAVAFDESSGKIAACTDGTVRIYRPLGHDHDSLKVSPLRLACCASHGTVQHSTAPLTHPFAVGVASYLRHRERPNPCHALLGQLRGASHRTILPLAL